MRDFQEKNVSLDLIGSAVCRNTRSRGQIQRVTWRHNMKNRCRSSRERPFSPYRDRSRSSRRGPAGRSPRGKNDNSKDLEGLPRKSSLGDRTKVLTSQLREPLERSTTRRRSRHRAQTADPRSDGRVERPFPAGRRPRTARRGRGHVAARAERGAHPRRSAARLRRAGGEPRHRPSRQTPRKVSDRLEAHGAEFDLGVVATHGGAISWKAEEFAPTIVPGPIGGVIGAKRLGEALGHENVACSGIGGTSFDVVLITKGHFVVESDPDMAVGERSRQVDGLRRPRRARLPRPRRLRLPRSCCGRRREAGRTGDVLRRPSSRSRVPNEPAILARLIEGEPKPSPLAIGSPGFGISRRRCSTSRDRRATRARSAAIPTARGSARSTPACRGRRTSRASRNEPGPPPGRSTEPADPGAAR